jgi:hypothetical protein
MSMMRCRASYLYVCSRAKSEQGHSQQRCDVILDVFWLTSGVNIPYIGYLKDSMTTFGRWGWMAGFNRD